MKKVLRYFQDQALEASESKYAGSSYLAPKTKEPQQQARHHSPSYYKDQHNSHHQSRSGHPSSAAHSFPAHTAAHASSPQPQSHGRQAMSGTASISAEIRSGITKHQYAQDNILQSYELYIPELDHTYLADPNGQKYWVIFIHGGYFRDPNVTSSAFYPALELLVSGKDHPHHHRNFKHDERPSEITDIKPHIAGYASLNYRLSPNPEKAPQDPQTTPAYELRNAKWPEHMHDVLTAIAHLQSKYGFGERYLIVGHSVGATMAVLSALAATKSPFSRATATEMPKVELPMAILGVSGIYDFPLLHATFPGYDGMTRNAIPNEADDVLASPAKYGAKEYAEAWTTRGKKRALVIAHSRDDGLVDWAQPEEMTKLLKNEANIDVTLTEIRGHHSEIYEKGAELARAIVEAVRIMRALEQ